MRKVKKWEPFERAVLPEAAQRMAKQVGLEEEAIFVNNRYQVNVRMCANDAVFGRVAHLSVKRRDKQPIFDWRDVQRMKNELLGPEVEMVQLFPAESRLVDGANQYHFFAFESYTLPFGFQERSISEAMSHGTRQRPFGEHAEAHPDLGTYDEGLLQQMNALHAEDDVA